MGKHTAYWEAYTRSQIRGTLRLSGAILAWVLAIALLAVWQQELGRSFLWLMGTAFIGFIVTITWLGMRAQKVVCPECTSTYTRSKWGGQCPTCGLGILQHDPD
jgi:hypothetical protein